MMMNLVTDPWLPLTNKKTELHYISLNQLFTDPDEWLDLALRPHERVSVMRFLICIVQAALDGGPFEDDWNNCVAEIPKKCLTYFDEWKTNFNLYDEKKPFLQIADLEPFNKEPTPITKIDSSLATGNNTTLFDHAGINVIKDVPKRFLEESNLVISMLSFNNFSLGGLYPQTKWKNRITPKSGVKDAPCASQSMLHCFIRGKTLIETLHANILTKEQIEDRYGENIGVPIWQCYPSSPTDEIAIKNATQTYIGRLVPLSRWLKILPGSNAILIGEGFVYPVYPDFTEASAVVHVVSQKNKQEYKILGCKSTTPWRELSAITTKRIKDKGDMGGPAYIENQSTYENYDLHILGIKRDKASILDTFESVLHVPGYFSVSEIYRISYDQGVKEAEFQADRLGRSIQKYLSFLLPDMVEIVNKAFSRKKLKKNESEKYQDIKKRVKEKYLFHYWTLIEKQRNLLLYYISLLGTAQDQDREQAKKAWINAINRAAEETYQTLCSQQSPRQMRAYVAGWQALYPTQSY
jgi:CRISPR system Cascade subunit CasA